MSLSLSLPGRVRACVCVCVFLSRSVSEYVGETSYIVYTNQ